VQAGSNHDSHPTPFRGADGYDTPTAPFSRQVSPTAVSVNRAAGTRVPTTHSEGLQNRGKFQPVDRDPGPLVLTRNRPASYEAIRS
jgi:hypothetical protein